MESQTRDRRTTPAARHDWAHAAWLLPLAIIAGLSTLIAPVSRGEVFRISVPWVPSLDVELSFRLDGLSLLFALLISGMGTLVLIYAAGYFSRRRDRRRLLSLLLLFMALMLGLVLADNIIVLFVFWELTSVSSYLLIGFQHDRPQARAAALQALLVTAFGGLALLAGLLLLGQAAGTYELSELVSRHGALQEQASLSAVVLILLGVFTKSAQFPFHFWLPSAMQAPTPVSAYLHSATMVKAGVYLVARLVPVLGGNLTWDVMLQVVGGLTAVMGGWLALQQHDLKRMLAFSTVSSLGLMMLLFGLASPLAIQAGVVLLLAHSLHKAAMFLIVGAVDHGVGSRDVRRLTQLAGVLPWLAPAVVLAAASKAGIPPAAGFLAKELTYEAALPSPDGLLLATALCANAMSIAVAFAVVAPFFRTRGTARLIHRVSWQLQGPPLVLAAVGVGAGLLLSPLASFVLMPAIAAISGEAATKPLKLWHGFTPALALGIATLALGVLMYAARDKIHGLRAWLKPLAAWGPSAGYEVALQALKSFSAWQTAVLQNGRLRTYLLTVLAVVIAAVGCTLPHALAVPQSGQLLDIRPYELLAPVLVLFAALQAVRTRSRLVAVCALGVIGYAVALLFVMFGAPDLAMTQFAVETLAVILFVIVMPRMPRLESLSSRRSRWRDALAATLAGGVIAAAVLAAIADQAPSRMARFYLENSQSEAHGRNVVNVILVDFRGLDTLGEIVVLATAAIGVLSLLRAGANEEAQATLPGDETEAAGSSVDTERPPQEAVAAGAGQ